MTAHQNARAMVGTAQEILAEPARYDAHTVKLAAYILAVGGRLAAALNEWLADLDREEAAR